MLLNDDKVEIFQNTGIWIYSLLIEEQWYRDRRNGYYLKDHKKIGRIGIL